MARHVIIGAGTAGWNAITTLRELDKGGSEIILVSEEAPYSRMVLPYYLAQSIGESHVYTASSSRLAELKVETRIGQRAEQIDSAAKKLVLAGCGKTIFHASTGSHERKICNVFNTCPVRPELVEG